MLMIQKIIAFVLLSSISLLLTTGLHAKGTKWQELKPVHLYSASDFHLKESVKCLELKTCMTDTKGKKCVGKSFSKVIVCSESLGYFDSKLIKKFKRLYPKVSKLGNIRKKTPINSITNGFSIDDKGTIWRLNEVKDIVDILGEIDTPAETQLVLWLHGKDLAKSYRKVSNGYEVLVEKKILSPCNGKKDYEEIFIYKRQIGKQGKISKQKLIKHTKKEVKHEYGEVKKPAIYLYPTTKQKINVSLNINGDITVSIPSYDKGWSVMVDNNGTIENRYDYLFYENTLKTLELPNKGWIKQGNELDVWFDVILPKLGLNAKETEQFKEYWLGELNKDALYEIKLFSLPFLSKNMTLTIDPKPDTLIRVIFNFKVIKEIYEIKEPVITTPERSGFHVLEWGGMIEGERQ